MCTAATDVKKTKKTVHRCWDISYDGYAGGKDVQVCDMSNPTDFIDAYADPSKPFDQASIVPIPMSKTVDWLPSPLLLKSKEDNTQPLGAPESYINNAESFEAAIYKRITDNEFTNELKSQIDTTYTKLQMNQQGALTKTAPEASIGNESTISKLAYQVCCVVSTIRSVSFYLELNQYSQHVWVAMFSLTDFAYKTTGNQSLVIS